ncbi:Protein O-GlcNAc transferase [Bertholletia excelsa]
MMHYQRYSHLGKGMEVVGDEDDESPTNLVLLCENIGYYNKRTMPRRLFTLLFLCLLSCSLILGPQFLGFPPSFSRIYERVVAEMDVNICSSVSNGSMCCERSGARSDLCILKGDVRTNSLCSLVYLHIPSNTNGSILSSPGPSGDAKDDDDLNLRHETIRPYTRKWEASTMATITELHLVSKRGNPWPQHGCDVRHDVPAIFFSTGGFTGNVYHEFNDGIIPLYITSQQFNKRVQFVILEYHHWWFTKYHDILKLLSDYPVINFAKDNRTHCFPEAIVGLKIHDELTVDPFQMEGGKSIKDFRDLLEQAYRPRIRGLIQGDKHNIKPSLPPVSKNSSSKPKLVILSRKGNREITNENLLVKMARQMGFEVEVLRPYRTTELAKLYLALNSSDVMVGVHGAAMTHLLFMRSGSVFIQVIPLGTEWAAEAYYGEPAVKLGLKYMSYKILPKESSLHKIYDKSNPILTDPSSIGKKGWQFTKKIYLSHQNVRLNLERFRKRLIRAYNYSLAKKLQHNYPLKSK